MTFGRYLKSVLWELLLCVAMVDGLGVPLMGLFYAAEPMSTTLIRLSLVALVLLLVLYLGIYHKLALVISLMAAVVILLALNLFLPVPKLVLVANAAPILYPVFWYLVGALLALLLYLATLTPMGAAAMFFLGTAATVVLTLMGERHSLPLFVLYLWACGCMYFFRKSESLQPEEGGTPASLLAATALFCAVSLGVAALFWSAAIRPLDYETRTLPFLQEESVENSPSPAEEESETPEETVTPTPSETTSQEPTTPPTEEPTPTPSETTPPEPDSPSLEDSPGDQDSSVIYFLVSLLKLLLGLLLLALIFLYPNLRRALFRRRMAQQPPRNQAVACYLRLQRQLPYLGLPPVGSHTPEEYAQLAASAQPWLEELSPGWTALTRDYCAALYGEESWDAPARHLLHFYGQFHAGCRKALGWRYWYLRYVLI